MKQQSGFTLIELIVVLVILGILAATALPKFTNMSVDARVAKMQGVAASIRGAAALDHGTAIAENVSSSGQLTLEDGSKISLVNYYPGGYSGGITSAIDIAGLYVTYTGTSQVNFASDSGRVSCVVTYAQGSTSSSVPVIDDHFVSAVSHYCQ